MAIDPLTDGAPLQLTHQGERVPNLRKPTPDQEPGAAVPGDQVLIYGSGKFDSIQLRKERQLEFAGVVGKTDRSLQLLGQKIDTLKAPLQRILKNFPPFSPQDEKRKELLMSYTSIRKQIEQLTFPPPPDQENPRTPPTLPEPLAVTADDSQITDHLAKLDAVAASVGALRERLAARVASFFPDLATSDPLSAPTGAEITPSGAAMTDFDAWTKSAEVGRQIAASLAQGVTEDRSQFLKVLSKVPCP